MDCFLKIKEWIIENTGFRELIDRYNKLRVFLYLDPPFLSSGKKYRYSFTMDDFRQLKEKMDQHSGSYIPNFSTFDPEMEEVFGKPDQVINYENLLYENGMNKWGCWY